MRILLVGEYSRLHNSLKEGLEALGQDATLVSTGDFFKDYPADIRLYRRFDSGLSRKAKIALHLLSGYDLTSHSILRQFMSHADRLRDYDVVQLINESPFAVRPHIAAQIVHWLHQNNNKMYVLSCGADHLSVQYAMGDDLPYSILQEYKDGRAPASAFQWALKYLRPGFQKLHHQVFSQIDGVIASDLDYHLPLKGHPKYLGLIPNPVNTDRISYQENRVEGKVRIFLGINRSNYHSKGIRYFEKALDVLKVRLGSKIHVEIVENLPYETYIKRFDLAHIVLDQVFGQDQGYNALEAMARGKVVFTGAGEIFCNHYNLDKPVAMEAVPDVDTLTNSLTKLIEDPSQIAEIGQRARTFVEREHNYKDIARSYLHTWKTN